MKKLAEAWLVVTRNDFTRHARVWKYPKVNGEFHSSGKMFLLCNSDVMSSKEHELHSVSFKSAKITTSSQPFVLRPSVHFFASFLLLSPEHRTSRPEPVAPLYWPSNK